MAAATLAPPPATKQKKAAGNVSTSFENATCTLRDSAAGTVSALVAPPDSLNLESGSERRRRIRDAVEAALSDVVLLGTQEQVRMAAKAADDMVAGRPIETASLVTSLRNFIREVLNLESVPSDVVIPKQGPFRVSGSGGRSQANSQAGKTTRQGGASAGDEGGMGAGVHAPSEHFR
ncbi:hypothetical protein [Polaromonas sp.]|uniref:hypothetical protein n=1 Tax=Polaromonas sp. TaxID=1869339 RepID=UPI00352BC7BA